MRDRMRCLSILGILWVASAPARAADIDDLKLGPVVHGPEVSAKDLKGRVVMVEMWGVG